ncbi:polysaccharide biosynthesis protein [Caloramator sp. E03]|uniref:putative polysaccharide biosynthesis protein n=1 Tax=Caloramator sp. E03 TaxID=2576307 RepID=UPI001110C16A|nr:polysaccharide biosynthesis protein [Caloramator sp. E03]QCX33750.1 polysaccharide biosynthesis protein [Caloramator sp. E03]
MQKKNIVRGTLILGIAGIVAKFLGFFFRIPLIYMIGEEGIGLYQLTYPLYTFLLGLSSGIPIAISKMISERMALNKTKEAFNVFKVALLIMGLFGGLSSIFLILFSNTIIYSLRWSRDVYYSLLGISLAPFFTCILSAYRGYFQGIQNMVPPAISQIIEQIIRVLVGVGLAYLLLPFGIPTAAGGASFGAVAGSIAGLLWVMFCYCKSKLRFSERQMSSSKIILAMQIFRIAIPISIGQAIGAVMSLIDSMMVIGLLKIAGFNEQYATILYGQLTGKAFVLINVPLTLSIALSQSTVPAISESFAIGDRIKIKRDVKMAYKLAMILALPCCAGLYTLAEPILFLVFQGYSDGWNLMQILSIAAFFIIIAQTSTSILNGIGKTLMPVCVMIIGSVIKIAINLIFIPIPFLNIKAAAYGTLITYFIVALIDFILVVKYTKVNFDFKEIFIKPLTCTIVMIFMVMLSYIIIYNFTLKRNLTTVISILCGIAIYFVMLFITRTLTLTEIKRII